MDRLYNQALSIMGAALVKLEALVPPPQKVPQSDSFVFRYVEKTAQQAMVQKLARVLSGLNATWLLLENRFVQVQAAMQRMLDEFHEDILFLALAVILNDFTSLHEQYLENFYQEEFDGATALQSTQKRKMVKREKIRAYVARTELAGIDPNRGIELSRTLHKNYSGYVHGASPHIMEMYGGNPPRFHVNGMRDTPRYCPHRSDLYNHFFRAIVACAFVAKTCGDEDLFQRLQQYHLKFDTESGRNNAFYPPS